MKKYELFIRLQESQINNEMQTLSFFVHHAPDRFRSREQEVKLVEAPGNCINNREYFLGAVMVLVFIINKDKYT